MATVYPSKYIYTPQTASYLGTFQPLNTTQYVYLPTNNFTNNTGNAPTVYDEFNPVVYMYLNPELKYDLHINTVEQALNHYTATIQDGLLIDINKLPMSFDYRIFDFFNSNIAVRCNLMTPHTWSNLRSNGDDGIKQLSIITYLRFDSNLSNGLGSNDLAGNIQRLAELPSQVDPLFNASLYRMMQNITSIATDDELYLQYMTETVQGNPVMGKPDDFRLAIQNYHSASLNVDSNLTVQGDMYITSLKGAMCNVDILGNFKVEGTIYASEFDCGKVRFLTLYVEGNEQTNVTELVIKQVGSNNVFDMYTNTINVFSMNSNGWISLNADGVLTPEAALDVSGDSWFRGGMTIDNSLIVGDTVSSVIFSNAGAMEVLDMTALKGGCIISIPGSDSDPDIKALTVTGAIECSGPVSGLQYNIASDARIKNDVRPIDPEAAKDLVRGMKVYDYQLLDQDKRSFGVLGQELEALCPQLVTRGKRTVSCNKTLVYRPETRTHRLEKHGLTTGAVLTYVDNDPAPLSEPLYRQRTTATAVVVDVRSEDEVILSSRDCTALEHDVCATTRVFDDFASVDYLQMIPILTACVQDLLNR